MAKRSGKAGGGPLSTAMDPGGRNVVDLIRHRLEHIADTKRGVRQRWEDAGLSTIRDFLSGRQKGQYGPTIGVLEKAVNIAGMSIWEFFTEEDPAKASAAAEPVPEELAVLINDIMAMFYDAGGEKPDDETVTILVKLYYKTRPKTNEDRQAFRERYREVIPLLVRRGRG